MRRVESSLSAFLRTGELGPIRRGLPFHELVALVGQPPDFDVWPETRHSPRLAWYGSVELGFYPSPPNRINYIQVQYGRYSGRFAGHRRLVLKDEGFDPNEATVEIFQRFARKHNIKLLPARSQWHCDDEIIFLTEGGVAAWFLCDAETGRAGFHTFITDSPRWFQIAHKPVGFAREAEAIGRRARP